MKSLPWTLLALLSVTSLTMAGPNAGGVLVVHDAQITFSSPTDLPQPPPSVPPATCSAVDNSVAASEDDTSLRVWKVYAAFPEGSCPRVKALAWGIRGVGWTYSGVFMAGTPDPANCFEIAEGSWPDPASGESDYSCVTQSFLHVQTSTMVECYWFSGYCVQGEVFATVPHARIPSEFADDDIYYHYTDAIAGFGSIGFGVPGTTPCPTPVELVGACCDVNGGCAITTQDMCQAPGIWWGACTICMPNPCPMPTGACCVGATCTTTAWSSCYGDWMGPNVPCVPNPCESQTGACCAPDGSCSITQQRECRYPSVWFGPDSVCTPNPCPQPVGACCYPPYDLCIVITQAACDSLNGTYYGDSTTCAPPPCPVRGACCFPTGECSLQYLWHCTQQGGIYQGDAHPCEPNTCTPTPTERTSWGRIKNTYR